MMWCFEGVLKSMVNPLDSPHESTGAPNRLTLQGLLALY
jgi:hypothetical protein